MFKVKVEKEAENFATISIEPLDAGFGHTLGNSIRRVLLTALEGSAVTSVKIDGVSHQFSNISGVLEDVIELILNIKKVRVKVSGDKPVKLTLKASGKKEVKAKDFEIEGDGQIANPEAKVATLTDAKSKLNMELTAEAGKGYSIAEERKINEIGVISIDALFTPIISANYTVEPTRVGRSAGYDKLVFDITTDGTITPLEAVNNSAKILSEAFHQVYEPAPEEEVKEVGPSVSDEVLKMTVEELDLPVRITNALRAIEVNTIEDLINIPKIQLLKAKNLGTKSVSLVADKLIERGLALREA